MTATRTRTARKSAVLLGIDPAQGHHCQDCDRELTARLFRVRVTATGEVRYLGRRCAALATGYPTTRLEHEARRLELLRQRDRAWAAGTVEELAENLREILIVNRDDTVEFAGLEGVRLVPLAEYAATEHARLQAALAAGDLD